VDLGEKSQRLTIIKRVEKFKLTVKKVIKEKSLLNVSGLSETNIWHSFAAKYALCKTRWTLRQSFSDSGCFSHLLAALGKKIGYTNNNHQKFVRCFKNQEEIMKITRDANSSLQKANSEWLSVRLKKIPILLVVFLFIFTNSGAVQPGMAVETPQLLYPTNGVTVTAIEEGGTVVAPPVAIPEFRWQAVSGATSYRIQFSQDIGFTTKIEVTTPHTRYIPINVAQFNDGLWYWRVRVEAPTPGFYSEPFSFTKDWASDHNFPVLSQPVDGATLDYFTAPTFAWQPVVGAASYRIQIASNPEFNNPQVNVQTLYPTYQPPSKVANGEYYWRVIPLDPANREGTPSAVRRFTMAYNYVPELIEPAHQSNPVFTPTFRWKAVKGAQTYQLQYSTDPSFNANVTHINTKNTTYTPQTAMPNDVNFYWRVRAISGASISDWSEVRSFIKKWYILPVLLTPTNLYQYVRHPFFSWAPVPGAAYYRIEIDSENDFRAPNYCFDTTANTTHVFPNNRISCSFSGITYWRVTPFDGSGNSGKHSETFSFYWGVSAKAPLLIYPLYYYLPNSFPPPFDSIRTRPYEDRTAPYPIFLWHRVTDSASGETVAPAYRIQVDDDPLFLSVDWQMDTENLAATPTSANPFSPIPGKDYYWRVCPLDRLGGNCMTTTVPVSGELWSQKWRVRFDPARGLSPLSGAPQLLRPVDSYEYVEMTPLFEWRAVQGATAYEIQISRDQNFTEIVDQASVPYPAYAPTRLIAQRGLLNRLDYGTYYWRVRAQIGAGFTEWSLIRRFQAASQSLWRSSRTLGAAENRLQIAADPDDTADNNYELTTLTATQDKDHWYFGFNATLGAENMVYVLYLDLDHQDNSGASSDARNYSIATIPAHRPEYAIYLFQQGGTLAANRVVIYEWMGTAWTNNPKTLQEVGGDLFVGDGFVEIKVPNTAIGMQTDSGSYSLALFSLPASSGNPRDSVPSDPNVPGSGQISRFTSVSERMMPRQPPNVLGGDPSAFPSVLPFFWDYPTGLTAADTPWRGYRVEVHLDPKFTNLKENKEFLSTFYLVPPFVHWEKDLIGDNTYYWRIRPIYSSAGGVWSQGMRFERTGFLAEELSESVTFATPTFSWSMVEGAESYDLQVDNDPNFGSPEVNINTRQNTFTPIFTLANGTYYWRVKVRRNGNVANEWSTVKQFNLALPQPSGLTPANEAIVNRAPTFCWNALVANSEGVPVLAAYKYRVQVSRGDPTFSTIYDSIETEQTCWTPTKGYDDGTYYWRVAMMDGEGRLGEYTAAQRFTKQYPITTLVSPTSGSTSSGTPKFVWSAVPGAAAYRLEVSTAPTFAPLYDSVTTHSIQFMPTKKYAEGTYYWRVAIVDKDNKLGPFNDAIIIVGSGFKVYLPLVIR